MNNSSTQLGLLSANLRQAAEVMEGRLQAVTDSLEQAGTQNRALAEQLSGQAQMLAKLQQDLAAATGKFEEAARLASQGFQSMQQHQQSFLQGIREEFQKLGNSLTQQVESIEKQADEWLREYSREVHTQVKERMEQWNESTLQFADQMRRTVSAIGGIVEDLEQKV
jgi:cysteinyl-tRNA synthetase